MDKHKCYNYLLGVAYFKNPDKWNTDVDILILPEFPANYMKYALICI